MVLLLALLLFWPAAGAQQPSQAPGRWPIESLTVEGASRYPAERILAVTRLKVGQVASKEDLEAARSRLMETGVLGSVGCRFGPSASGKGLLVTFQVVEVAEVYPFRFERLEAPAKELEEWLRSSDPFFGDRIPATEPVLNRCARAIEAFLASRNKAETVAGRLTADNPGQLVVVFSPAAPPPAVAEVRFTGNTVIPSAALQSKIAEVAIGMPYNEARFRQALEASIRPLYDARGRIRVAFPQLLVERAQDVAGVAVTVEVVEGDVYELGEVRLQGEALPEKELHEAGDFKAGDVANFSAIEAGLERIKNRLRRQGFLKPETSVERRVDDQKKKVDLVVHVDKGPRFVFGKLTIEGLDLNAEVQLRRLWGAKPGAPFDADYPDYFLGRIREDGVFDNLGKTRSAIKIDDQSLTVDVILYFLPASPKKGPRAAGAGAHAIVERCVVALERPPGAV
jgi:outer membrane protein insertion porin family